VSVAPIDEGSEHDDQHAEGLALNLGPENKAMELFVGSSKAQLQIALKIALKIALSFTICTRLLNA
jgi:hypothetical protein